MKKYTEELAEMFEREISGGVVCPPKHTHKYCDRWEEKE